MLTRGILIFSLSVFANYALARVYNCEAVYEIIPDDQPATEERLHGVFDTGSANPNLELRFDAHAKRGVSLVAANPGSIVILNMGDYCGELWQQTNLPGDPGSFISSQFSFGRNPTSGDWEKMDLYCVEQSDSRP